jgi:hypothetical protein
MTTSPRTIHVIGAKGGVGTSTVAALIALEEQDAGNQVHLVAADGDQGDLRAILGLASGYNDEPVTLVGAGPDRQVVTVIDHGTSTADGRLTDTGPIYLVMRGPCYLGLRRALALPFRADGVILLTEKDRSLGKRDIEDCTGLKVVAEVEVTPTTARYLDAGIVASTRRRPRIGLTSMVSA